MAGGECNHGIHEFKLLIDNGYDVLQPDAVLSEGIYQLRKVAALAEVAGLEVAPHTWTHGIGMLANFHSLGVHPQPFLVRVGWPASAFSQMLLDKPAIDTDGCLAVPDRPGFGFTLDEELIEGYTVARFG